MRLASADFSFGNSQDAQRCAAMEKDMNDEIKSDQLPNFNELVAEHLGATDASIVVLARVVNELCRTATHSGWADAASLGRAFDEAAASVLRPEGLLALNKEAHRRIPALRGIVLGDLPLPKKAES